MCAAKIKRSIDELAIRGGPPLFDERLHVGRPNILDPDDLCERIRDAIARNWLTNDGPLVLALEKEFAAFLEVKHCVAVANATLGLQLLVNALGIRGKVLMPSFTFIATAHAVNWQGATPVFCDVLDDKHTLDPERVREAMSSEIKAIMGVHVWGRACEIDELQAIADEWKVPLIFDAAHALGSNYKGVKLGRFGRAEVFSLHATKAINAIEGGFVTTDDDELANKLRAARNYGFAGLDTVSGLGINAKLNEFCAAMALSNLPHYDRLAEHNRRLHLAYERALAGVPGIRFNSLDLSGSSNGHYAVFQLESSSSARRDALLDALIAENVYVRRYFWPGCHRSPPYSEEESVPMPVTDRLAETVFQLPTGLQLDEADATAIGRCVVLWMQFHLVLQHRTR